MSLHSHITGLVPAVFTPMHPDGQLNLELIPVLAERLIGQQVGGFYVCGSTGEGPSLTREERMAVAEAYVQAANGRIPVIVQVGHNSVHESKLLAQHAQDSGADAISAVPPSYFRPNSMQNLVDVLAEIMQAAPDLPFYYYHIPHLSNVAINVVELLESSTQSLPNLVGIKYSNFTVFELQACLEVANGRFNMLFGSDEMLLSGLVGGAHGAVGSTYNFAAPLFNRIIAAHRQNDITEATRLQSLAVKMIRPMYGPKANAHLKHMMKLIGIDCGTVRLPLARLTAAEEMKLQHCMEAIGFFEWGAQ